MKEDFLFALKRSDLKKAEQLLATGLNVNEPDGDAIYPIRAAIASDNPEVLKWLIDHGADVNIITDDDGIRPLHEIMDYGIGALTLYDWDEFAPEMVEMLHLLLENGADCALTNAIGETTLDYFKKVYKEAHFNHLKDLFRPFIPDIDERIFFK